MKITRDQARLCAEFMLDENPLELMLPYNVAKELAYYERTRSLHSAQMLADVLQDWYDTNREACMALLAPGLEDD